jgi:hypothetical protein
MPKRKLPYKEGTWFALPLRDDGFAVGVAARLTGDGIVLGYFFGRRFRQAPSMESLKELTAQDAILICCFGDLGLLRKGWVVIAHDPQWNRDAWPLPRFGRIAVAGDWATSVVYDEENINRVLREVPMSVEEARLLPEDGLSGYGAVEIRLTNLLKGVALE